MNRDLTSASYVRLLPLVGVPSSRGIFIMKSIGYGVKFEFLRPLARVAARGDVR